MLVSHESAFCNKPKQLSTRSLAFLFSANNHEGFDSLHPLQSFNSASAILNIERATLLIGTSVNAQIFLRIWVKIIGLMRLFKCKLSCSSGVNRFSGGVVSMVQQLNPRCVAAEKTS